MKMSEEVVYQIEEWIEETKIMKFQNQRKGNENEKDFCKHWQILNKLNKGKVLSLFEACFDLILSPSPSMKTQIMGGKITENLGLKSPQFFCPFSVHFQILHKNCISLFLTIFEYLVLCTNQIIKNKDCQHALFDFK